MVIQIWPTFWSDLMRATPIENTRDWGVQSAGRHKQLLQSNY
jgi:hypothetical protein